MSAAFESATAVSFVAPSRYAGEIRGGWEIAGNANGGYLLAVAARAIAAEVGRPPLSITAHYLAPGKVGPVETEVEVVRSGRRAATARARLRAAGVDVLAVLGTFGEQTPGGLTAVSAVPPDLPNHADCVRTAPPAPESGFGDRVDVRVRPDDAEFQFGRASGTAEVAGWFEFADTDPVADPIDAFGLLLVADAFAPVCFNIPGCPLGWAPTLELTVQIRGVPAPGRLRCRFSSRAIQDGLFEEDGEIWDSAGTLVALSRQLAMIPRG